MAGITQNPEIVPDEIHPLEPFLPPGAKLLMCGTFPPKRNRWSMDFYYPNYINDMWRIFGLIYFGDKDALVDTVNKTFRLKDIKNLLRSRGIALSDTGRRVTRLKDNASDKWLRIDQPIDLAATFEALPECVALATTGEKAAGVIAEATGTPLPKAGSCSECTVAMPDGTVRRFRHWRMPSSSRAYPLSLEKKTEAYRIMLDSIGLIDKITD